MYATNWIVDPSKLHPTRNGEWVVLACYAVPGWCYPISRKADYPREGRDLTESCTYYTPPPEPAVHLKHNFQSHYTFVSQRTGYQCELNSKPHYDELVLQDKTQLVPAYRLYFSL